MNTIGDVLSRDLNRTIEEIIKLDQTDEHAVYTELTEYVATDRIRDQYRDLLRAIADAPADPHEGIGVWVSGFFGSGKSSFAKNLGYLLANHTLLGHAASELFLQQVEDRRIAELIDLINTRYPAEVLMFDVRVEHSVRSGTERIAEIMYTVLLRQLGYADQDFMLAELEMELENEGKLDEFTALCEEIHQQTWRIVRKGSRRRSRASAILHRMDPATYPSADSWAHAQSKEDGNITIGEFVERAFDLCTRRRPGKALVFIMDEVGQYVARSSDKIEDLRAIVEQFGKVGRNLMQARKIIAPVWIVVTSQEKLDEVVAALDSKRVRLATLQDRFKYRFDMAPADIREVATRRVLSKKPDAIPVLQRLYQTHAGSLNASCRLERTSLQSAISEDDFVQFYPYLPHYVELSIDIMSGIRQQTGSVRHMGGSNRTIIKQTYEMLVSERTHLASRPIGTLVTLDKMYELVEANLSSEKTKDISDIQNRFPPTDDSHSVSWEARVAKVICLLEFVRDLPRTEHNIAALLVDTVTAPPPLDEVTAALTRLNDAQFARITESGWKLQTIQEKNWHTERRSLSPMGKDRNLILRDMFADIFNTAKLKTYRYKDMRTFRVGISVEGSQMGDPGQITLTITMADDDTTFPSRVADVRNDSRQPTHANDIYWVGAMTAEIDDLVQQVYASQQMITKYNQVRAQQRITTEEMSCLTDENTTLNRYKAHLKDKLTAALEQGQGLFRGVAKDGSQLGKTLPEIIKGVLDIVVPDLYPKLDMGARQLKGTEPEEILKAANLNALSQVFYDGEHGLGLVVQDGTSFVPDVSADVARELLDYLKREQAYGNKVTGRTLEEHFQGFGYGWERDILRLVLAVLLRAGVIEVTYQGRRFRNHQDPQCRVPFTNNMAFKTASFAPRESIGVKTLIAAAKHYEEISGEEVDVEEGTIAAAFKRIADEEVRLLLPLEALVQAHRLPIQETLQEYRQTLTAIQNADSDDVVRILSGEGATFKDARDHIRKLRMALDEPGIEIIQQARTAMQEMWPVLSDRSAYVALEPRAATVQQLVASEAGILHRDEMAACTTKIADAYYDLYTMCHQQRTEAYTQAIARVQEMEVWALLDDAMHESVLAPLRQRAQHEPDVPAGATVCHTCHASLRQLESDVLALDGITARVMSQVRDLTLPADQFERVQVASFFRGNDILDSEEAIEQALGRLREHLLALLAEGVKIILE